ncbi:MAG: response regulator transcription factor [Chloroflexi bacterium]|nr:response regulator transcription factor [Chloroflexota bacterium]MCI0576691.1 response regulator transcription factor [Chloroflexota bacterium]MCI0646855.1 response regulator transcription factor [Chloroflexota bacterium]
MATSEKHEIRVLIADDFDVLRKVIRLFLERAGDIVVVDEAPDLNDALASTGRLQPDVVIMNDYLPPIDSAHATGLFRAQGFAVAILIISMHLEPDLIRRSLAGGANGFMHKDEIGDHLVDAVRHVHQGESYLSPKAGQALDSADE